MLIGLNGPFESKKYVFYGISNKIREYRKLMAVKLPIKKKSICVGR